MTDGAVGQPKMKKPWYMKWWVWLIAGLLLIGVISNLVNPAEKIAVPDVSGLTAVEAKAKLEDAGLRVSVEQDGRFSAGGDRFDAVDTDPAAGEEVSAGSKVILNVTEATERLAAEKAEAERIKAEEDAAREAEAAEKKAATEAANTERAAAFEQSIKNAFGGAEFSDLLLEDPSGWAGWISQVRVEGGDAYVRLQLHEEGKTDDIGERAARALSTLLSKDDVEGIDWIIVEDASGVVIGQKQPSPLG